MKKLANLKGSSDSGISGAAKSKKSSSSKNNPYPLSGTPRANVVGSIEPSLNGHLSFATQPSVRSVEDQSLAQSRGSLPISQDEQAYPTSKKSAAPTVSTNPGTTHSDTAQSKAGTATTAAGGHSSNGIGGEGSTFSSPAPSVRSMNTTLTTIQSGAPNNALGSPSPQGGPSSSAHQSVQFSHQYPTTATSPASAIPSHMVSHAGGGHPATYTTATANNLLTDNASILTLASSSKRRRRNSLDTNASVRALAPSSIFGGSRESLPLSVLSGPVPDSGGLSAVHNRPSIGGLPAAERASVYSASGVAPNTGALSERNSYYANPKAREGDGGSIRSGKISHGRNDSITGSVVGVTGVPSSPLASPREGFVPERISRRSSGWDGEGLEEESVHSSELGRIPTEATINTASEK